MSLRLESEELQLRLLFPMLTELDLSINHLHSLTSDIGEQHALKILSLRGNRNLKEVSSSKQFRIMFWAENFTWLALWQNAVPGLISFSAASYGQIVHVCISVQ